VAKGGSFTAMFDSEGACGHLIEEGDRAGYVDDEVVCGDCWDEDEGVDDDDADYDLHPRDSTYDW
jgi:hypothetical protein